MIEVEINRGQYTALKRMLATIPNELPKVVTRALNKVARATYIRILRRISKDYTVSQSELKKRNIVIRRASYRHQVARIKITGRRIRLLAFKARQLKGGISYKIKKSGGRKRVYAFMESPVGGSPTVMPGGHKGVFRRKGKSTRRSPGAWSLNLPIIELFGPSIPAVFQTTPEFKPRVLQRNLSGKLGREMISQANFVIAKRRGIKITAA